MCPSLSLNVLPYRALSFSRFLDFSKNGKRVDVELKSDLAPFSVIIPCCSRGRIRLTGSAATTYVHPSLNRPFPLKKLVFPAFQHEAYFFCSARVPTGGLFRQVDFCCLTAPDAIRREKIAGSQFLLEELSAMYFIRNKR